jgi:Flp pilus assembly protein TadD
MFEYWFSFHDGKARTLFRISEDPSSTGFGERLDQDSFRWRPSATIFRYVLFGEMDYEKTATGEAEDFVRELDPSLSNQAIHELLSRPIAAELEGPESTPESAQEELAEEYYQDAISATEAGFAEIASGYYRLVLKIKADDYQAMTNLAVILDKSNQRDEAEQLYLTAANRPFFDSHAMFNLGYLYGRESRPDDAETWYRRSLLANPEHTHAMVNLAGLLHETKGDIQESKTLLESAIRLDPHDEIAIYQLANLYREGGKSFEAEVLYRKAVEVSPKDPKAIYNLAAFLDEVGVQDEARKLFDLAHDLDHGSKLKTGED